MWLPALLAACVLAAPAASLDVDAVCDRYADPPEAAAADDDDPLLANDPFSCRAQDADVLMFNRVPKTASSSVIYALAQLSAVHGFDTCFEAAWEARRLSEPEQRAMAALESCSGEGRVHRRDGRGLAVVDHVFWMNWTAAGAAAQPAYFAVLREPVERCASALAYYARRGGWGAEAAELDSCEWCRFEEWTPADAWRAYDEFQPGVGDGHVLSDAAARAAVREECSSNYQSRWLCGMDERCWDAATALAEAKRRLVFDYASFGLVEALDATLMQADAVLPGYFRFAAALPPLHANRSPRGAPGAASPVLERLNAADMELYAFAQRLFAQRMRRCCAEPRFRETLEMEARMWPRLAGVVEEAVRVPEDAWA